MSWEYLVVSQQEISDHGFTFMCETFMVGQYWVYIAWEMITAAKVGPGIETKHTITHAF